MGAQAPLVDRIAAVIEDEIITVRELEAIAKPQLAAAESTDLVQQAAQRRKIMAAVLDAEIGERMLQREIRRDHDRLAVSDKEVDKAIDEVARTNHVDRTQLQQALFAQGMSLAQYRSKMRDQLERTRLVQFRVQGRVQIKDIDVMRRCREQQRLEAREPTVCAQHILISLAEDAAEPVVQQAKQRAQRLRAAWTSDANFAASRPADRPTDLGCFRRGEMLEAIDAVAFDLPVGVASVPVRSPLGLHLVRISERRATEVDPCEDEAARERFRGTLYQEEMQRQMLTWMEELRKKAFVEIRLDGSE
jgi:peptidyl-prolyl cis-trans isomerase SurA